MRLSLAASGGFPHTDANLVEGLSQALDMTRNLPGCYLELGVFAGSSAFAVMSYIRSARLNRPVVLMDSFTGFSESPRTADIKWKVVENQHVLCRWRCLFTQTDVKTSSIHGSI